MEKRSLILLALLLICSNIFSQKQEKLYYNSEWKVSIPELASYYRIINYNAIGTIEGEIKNYYNTGELHSTIEEAKYIDKLDDENSICVGKMIGYYKSGIKKIVQVNNNKGIMVSMDAWYENGNKQSHIEFINGKINGIYTAFHENGTLATRTEFKEGIKINKWTIRCDELENCQKVFFEIFDDDKNPNTWPLLNKKKQESEFICNSGLKMKASSKKGFKQLIKLPFDNTVDFEIACLFRFIEGAKEKRSGLVWDYTDENNYRFFYLSANGNYTFGRIKSGEIYSEKKSSTNLLLPYYESNTISITKDEKSIYYYINGGPIGYEVLAPINGTDIGFYIDGKQTVLFQGLNIGVAFMINE